jgi:hypothetical protein
MTLTFPNLVRAWIQEEYTYPPFITKEDIVFYESGYEQVEPKFEPYFGQEIQVLIFGFHHCVIHPTFLRFSTTSSIYDRTSGKYLSMMDPKMFDILRTWLNIAIYYRYEWIQEVNREEHDMFLEDTYDQGGYAT